MRDILGYASWCTILRQDMLVKVIPPLSSEKHVRISCRRVGAASTRSVFPFTQSRNERGLKYLQKTEPPSFSMALIAGFEALEGTMCTAVFSLSAP
jgi:hypothetical protein